MVRFTPQGELTKYGVDQVFQHGEVSVVGAQPAGQFPDALDDVEFRTVGGKEIGDQFVAMVPQPRIQVSGMMPFGIIDNEDHPSSPPPMPEQLDQEGQERLGFELGFPSNDQLPGLGMNRPVEAHRFAGRRMQDHGIDVFGRHPHGAA